MITSPSRSVLSILMLALAFCACNPTPAEGETREPAAKSIPVQYLEVVTPDVDATCDALAKMHGVSFSEPDAGRGNARSATLKGGGEIGVRAPMRETEAPVVRPYLLVDDIEAAVKTAEAAGAQIAMPPTPIPGDGTFAIYILGGIQHGLWKR